MSNEIGRGPMGWLTTVAAVFLGALGMTLLFTGQEVGAAVLGRADVEPLASVLGGALIGFGSMSWISRKSTLGGIYGRAVVVGNQTQFVVGAIVLLKYGIRFGGSTAYWVIASIYTLGAVAFTTLLLSPGVRRRDA